MLDSDGVTPRKVHRLTVTAGVHCNLVLKSSREFQHFKHADDEKQEKKSGVEDDDDEDSFRVVLGSVLTSVDARLIGVTATLARPVTQPHRLAGGQVGRSEGLQGHRGSSTGLHYPIHILAPFDVTIALRTAMLSGDDAHCDLAFPSPAVTAAWALIGKHNSKRQLFAWDFIKQFTTASVRVYQPIDLKLSHEDLSALSLIVTEVSSPASTTPIPRGSSGIDPASSPKMSESKTSHPIAPPTCGGVEVSLRKISLALVHHTNHVTSGGLTSANRHSNIDVAELHPVFEVILDNIVASAVASLPDTSAQVVFGLASSYHNSRVGSWEPFIEPWRMQCSLSLPNTSVDEGSSPALVAQATQRYYLGSDQVLNVNLTEAMLETLTDVACAWRGLPPRVPHFLLDAQGTPVCEMVVRHGSRIVSVSSTFLLLNRLWFPLHIGFLRQDGPARSSPVTVLWQTVLPPGGVCGVPMRHLHLGSDAKLHKFRFKIAEGMDRIDLASVNGFRDVFADDLVAVMTSRLGTALKRSVRATNIEFRLSQDSMRPSAGSASGTGKSSDALGIPRSRSAVSLAKDDGFPSVVPPKSFHCMASLRQDEEAARIIGRLMKTQGLRLPAFHLPPYVVICVRRLFVFGLTSAVSSACVLLQGCCSYRRHDGRL